MDPLTLIALKLGATFVPQILGKLTGDGNVQEVAQRVVDVASQVTGISDPAKSLEALQADAKLAQEFQLRVMDNEKDLEQIYAADRDSARKMQIAALQQDDNESKRFIYRFAWFWSAFAMIYFTAVTFIPLSPPGQRVADTILGVLIATVIGAMIQFFYGSSRSSQRKDYHTALTSK